MVLVNVSPSCDEEKMSLRDGSMLESDIGILSLENWDDKAAV